MLNQKNAAMRFHLNHQPARPDFELRHGKGIFLTGSCFSENMAAKLKELRFSIYSNPGGILFNPISIQQNLSTIIRGEKTDPTWLIQRSGVWFSYRHHSSIHDEDRQGLIRKIDHDNKTAAQFLKQSELLIVTLGSAYVYHHRQLNGPVANCHKQPGSDFEKRLLSVEEIVSAYKTLLHELKQNQPALKFLFSVSPVRYLKDGLVENSLSKATLLLATHELVRSHPDCFYFPAYELVSEDLRDYRFYKEDLAHPNAQAIDYVWGKFSETFFSETTQQLNREIHALQLALDHRRLIHNSEEALQLNNYILKQKELLRRLAPEIDFNH